MRKLILLLALTAMAVVAISQSVQPGSSAEANGIYRDIRNTLGILPGFLREFPPEGIAGAWEETKSLYGSGTRLSIKTKALIALAVDAQVPCRACAYFSTEVARLQEASPREIRESVAMASITRHWSTVLNGLLLDEDQFRRETAQIIESARKGRPTAVPGRASVRTAEEAYSDIQASLGILPTFLREFPRSAIAGAWTEMKSVQLNPATALSGKDKELIGLAVAAQIPCRYCVHFHTEAAKLNGATQDEVREALAVSAVARHWSTFLNGMQTPESEFKRDVTRIISHFQMRKREAERKQLGGEVGPRVEK